MIILFTVLIILACIVLGFFILVQNPKGGGLTGAFGSLGSQVMGVKQSTDVMEKGTWYTIAIIAALAILSVAFFDQPSGPNSGRPMPPQNTSAPANTP